MTRVRAIEVDDRGGSAYLYFEKPARGASVRQVNIGDAVIFDFGKDGRLLGIELLDPKLAAKFAQRSARQALKGSRVPIRRTA